MHDSFACYALANYEYTRRTVEPIMCKHNVIHTTGST